MKRKIPVGTKISHEGKTLVRGDVIELVTGIEVTFIEVKRSRFIAKKSKGKLISVPFWRVTNQLPYVVKITGKDKEEIIATTLATDLMIGDLFYIQDRKTDVFLFITTMMTSKKGLRVKAKNIANGRVYTLYNEASLVRINLPKLRRELV